MPLHHVEARPWIDGFGVRFPMQGDAGEIRCYVHQGALDMIEQTMSADMHDQLKRFERHRPLFEAIASDLHDAGLPPRVTADHVAKLRGR